MTVLWVQTKLIRYIPLLAFRIIMITSNTILTINREFEYWHRIYIWMMLKQEEVRVRSWLSAFLCNRFIVLFETYKSWFATYEYVIDNDITLKAPSLLTLILQLCQNVDALYFGQVSVTTTLTGKTAEPITKVRYTTHYFYHNVLIHISHRILLFLLQLYLLRPGLSTEQMVGITNLTLRYVIIIFLLLTVHLQRNLN